MATRIVVSWLRALIPAALWFYGGLALAEVEYKIVTANEKGTYFAIGADLAKYVAPEAGISLEVLPTDGLGREYQASAL